MSLSEAAKLFHNGNYAEAAEILKKNLYNATPNIEHNLAISDYYTKVNPRSQSKLLLKQLNNLETSYPKPISSRASLLFNEAELHLNRHQYSKSEEIFKSLINSVDDNVPVNIYFRSCLRLFSIYLHHDMLDNATLIHSKLTTMKAEDITALDECNDRTVSALKHSYWCHIIGCHLKLIESSSSKSSSMTQSSPVQAAYKELTKAIDLVKKKKNNQKEATQASCAWDVDYKIRILFLKAHQDFISGNVNTARSQLFQTHSHYKNKQKMKPCEQTIAFLNNMSCIYALNDEVGSAMSLIHRALSLHAQFMDKEPLYSADHMIGYLCYNAGLYLQNMQQYYRSIDSFLCCLPVLQSKPRLWLRMAQCILAIWEPYGGFEHNRDGQPQINSLVQDIIEADSTKRGDLYLLPIGRKTLLYNNRSPLQPDGQPQQQQDGSESNDKMHHILKWHERNDSDYGFPYQLYKEKEEENEIKRKKRWKKRKQKQREFVMKTDAIIHELDASAARKKAQTTATATANNNNNNNNNNATLHNKEQKEQERVNKLREKRLYEKEKANKMEQEKKDAHDYKLQIRELNDLKLAIEWLKNAISLFKKMETKLYVFDYDGHISAHLHLSYCYLQLKAWNFAFRHAEQTINIYKKQQSAAAKHKQFGMSSNQPQTAAFASSHTTYLAGLYAAEALIHLNKFNAAIQHLNPINFPHMNAQLQQEKDTPKSSKSSKSKASNKSAMDRDSSKPNNDMKDNALNSNNTTNGQNNGSNNHNTTTHSEDHDTDGRSQNGNQSNIKTKEQYKRRMEEKQIKQQNDNYLAIWVNLATTYICKDALDKAHKYIHKALTLNDEYYPALRMLVYLHMRMGNNSEAIKILKYRRPIPVKQFMQQNDSYTDTLS